MTQAFLYKWTQKLTGMWYVGSRTAKGCHITDGYICSSKKVKPMIQENRNDWSREILCIGQPDYIVELEANYLITLNAKDNINSYNLHNGDGKFNMTGQQGYWAGKSTWNKGLTKEDSRVAIGAAKGGVTRRGRSPWNKGLTKEDDNRIKTTSGCFDKNHIPWNKNLPSEQQPWYGKKHSNETKELLSAQKQGNKNPAFGKKAHNKGVKTGKAWFNNGTESKLFVIGMEPTGFIKGRITSFKWYNNGVKECQFKTNKQPYNYTLGRLKCDIFNITKRIN